MKQKLLFLLVLLITAVTGAWAQDPATYTMKMAEDTEDATNWTISPAEATTTGVAEGKAVTATYAGALKVKSVRATVKKPAKTVDLSTLTGDYEAQDGDVLTGELSDNYKITIAAGATVTLDGVEINGENNENYKWAGITCSGDATIILKDGTENTVKGFHENYPGIYVPENKTVTIQGDGSLAASSNGYGAGIGGGNNISCGNIVIEGGTIEAWGGNSAAAIGSGNEANCGNITIKDTVTKVTTYMGGDGMLYCIGKGYGTNNTCGTITVGSVSLTTGGLGGGVPLRLSQWRWCYSHMICD